MFDRIKSFIVQPQMPINQRFPKCEYKTTIMTRKTGLSTNELDPNIIFDLIKRHRSTLDSSNQRAKWIDYWIRGIEYELYALKKYNLEEVGRILIIQDGLVVFDFYMIYDIHINDVETIHINLNHYEEQSSKYANVVSSLGMVSGMGVLGYILMNIFLTQ